MQDFHRDDYNDEDHGDQKEMGIPIPHQRDLNPPCYCDITYTCDECRKNPREKMMDAI